MAAGGFSKLPNGTVVVALNLPSPAAGSAGSVRVLVHAGNRARALTRLRNLGLRAVYLRGNAAPPSPDEITAVLHHPDGLIWRTAPDVPAPDVPALGSTVLTGRDLPGRDDLVVELWHPIRALLGRPTARA
ncbi:MULTISPECIES: hypothetical protein [unclassified Streptomyces]|uniref:hypothetical protein n=1 Tax=unclassified Streptomyces TaxID=2593676 RepID=UPI0005A8030A|nr:MULTISPECIES: hypothetical protein [unclassified Streptomyces]ODA75084.1 hypothetical protein APS67_000797 [Streptomyces sp. AVP053U2]